MNQREILAAKRDGQALSEGQINDFIHGYVAGEVPDHTAAALMMAIFVHGMEREELQLWTRAMLESGEAYDFSHLGRPTADKHSTGGVGDKVSIPLAPAVAACGVAVPMVSGRGLGHTGGTLDKLESIPGFSTHLTSEEFKRIVEETGMALCGQTDDLVPADKKLYALRDVTGLIESIPLIASSILSKKLAEGLDALVLDVKFGSGAFMVDRERGAELARVMVEVAGDFGLKARAFQTAMDRPLGAACGNALEIAESIECLRGGGPQDLRELVVTLGGAMLESVGERDGPERIGRALDDGAALGVFEQAVEQQGGDPSCLHDLAKLPRCEEVETIKAPSGGHLAYRDVREVGRAVSALGGGRVHLHDEIDPAVGVVCLRRAGEQVEAGEELFSIHHRAGRGLDQARQHLERSVEFGSEVEVSPLVLPELDS